MVFLDLLWCFACQLMPCSFGHKDTRGLSTGLHKYPTYAALTLAVLAAGLPLSQRVSPAAWSLGEQAAKDPREVAGGMTLKELKLQAQGTCSVVSMSLTSPVRLHLQIMNSKIMLFKFLRCQLQRMKPQAQWLNVVVCAVALINILMKLLCRGTFLTRVSQ